MPRKDQNRALSSFSVKDWPFYWLTRAAGLYLSRMADALRPAGLDIPRWRVLMILSGHPAASIGELAEHSISKLSTMTRIVQRMQADGLVRSYPRDSDGRVTEVELTAAGIKAAGLAWTEADRLFNEVFEHRAEEDRRNLTGELRRLFVDLGGSEAD